MESANFSAYGTQKFTSPSITNKLRYFARYFPLLGRAAFQQHSPVLDVDLPVLEADFSVSSVTQAEWCSFYRAKPNTPFSYHISASAIAILRYCKLLGVKYSKLMFYGSRLEYFEPFNGADTFVLYFRYLGAQRFGKRGAILKFESTLQREAGVKVLTQVDSFYVADAYKTELENAPVVAQGARTLTKKVVKAKKVTFQQQLVWGWALRFGWVSGDLNLQHILPSVKWLNEKPAYVQGLGLLNALINQMQQAAPAPLSIVEVLFHRPVYEQAKLTLKREGSSIYLLANGKLVVSGSVHFAAD